MSVMPTWAEESWVEGRKGAAHAARALAVDMRGIQRDQRELGRDKHRGAKRQEDARTDEQPGGHVRPRLWSSMGVATIPGAWPARR